MQQPRPSTAKNREIKFRGKKRNVSLKKNLNTKQSLSPCCVPSLASELVWRVVPALWACPCPDHPHSNREMPGTRIAISREKRQAQRGDLTSLSFHPEKRKSLALELGAQFYR